MPVLFNQYGLNEIWGAEYEKVGVKHISAGAWDPCHFATKDPIHSLADLEGKRVFTFPTAGRFLTQFGVVPVTLPWEDIEVAVQTGELDGVAWSGITEDYTVGWADVTNYFLTNNISGAWIGHFYANMERWNEVPEDLQTLLRVICDQSHYYRQWWYWGGEASLRVHGTKMQLTSIPDDEWAQVEAAARTFWDEIAAESETKAKVVEVFKQYNADMERAGRPLPLRLIRERRPRASRGAATTRRRRRRLRRRLGPPTRPPAPCRGWRVPRRSRLRRWSAAGVSSSTLDSMPT